jgi:hypothetical protein
MNGLYRKIGWRRRRKEPFIPSFLPFSLNSQVSPNLFFPSLKGFELFAVIFAVGF